LDVREDWRDKLGRCEACGFGFRIPGPDPPPGNGQTTAGSSLPGTVGAGGLTLASAGGAGELSGFSVEGLIGAGGMGNVFLAHRDADGQRYAVKHARLPSLDHRRRFLRELQLWIDLPEHPNLAACRFFRTAGQEVFIFAEYVDNGSLRDWISGGRLYPGDVQTVLKRILNIAIQFAWGLDALHTLALVHQDVKPGNVLLSRDHVAKVTDFGISRGVLAGGIPSLAGSSSSLVVTCGGMTHAYCSPEQSRGERLTHRTDVWSWGVSVLEMFLGTIAWRSGPEAPRALREYLDGHRVGAVPDMPADVATVLWRCLVPVPESRWPTLANAAAALIDVYTRIGSGTAYPERCPPGQSEGPLLFTVAIPTAGLSGKTRGSGWSEPCSMTPRTPPAPTSSFSPAPDRERRRSSRT
jgi:serine/threonine protein kinase